MRMLTSLVPSESEATALAVCRSMALLSLLELVVFAALFYQQVVLLYLLLMGWCKRLTMDHVLDCGLEYGLNTNIRRMLKCMFS